MNSRDVNGQSMLSCENICFEIGERAILRDCTLSVDAGEFVVVVGPNGAGKTTLLQSITGILKPRGTISWAGKNLDRLKPSQRAQLMSYLPQNGGIYWPMRVKDVVALGRLPYGNDNAEGDHLISKALDQCGVLHLKDQIATTLSGGERSRVLLARTFATQAKLLLVDEPLNSLDPKYQLDIMTNLKNYCRTGASVIAVLHDINMCLQFADRIIVLKDGSIFGNGASAELVHSGLFEEAFDVKFSWQTDAFDRISGMPICGISD